MNLPKHKCSLSLTHNKHRDYYQTAAQAIAEQESYECPPNWKDYEAKKRAIATDEIWELQWYPDTPIGSYCICAPTLEEVLAMAAEVDLPNTVVTHAETGSRTHGESRPR